MTLVLASPALAHRAHHHPARLRHEQSTAPWWNGGASWRPLAAAASESGRPSDCYHIPWCGCWLRHHFGLADRALNLARAWASIGHATSAHAGAIVVWSHHVGVLQSDERNGSAMVLSGNDGHAVRERERSLRGAIAFRQL